ncbi:MAG: hypothetical protein J6O55_00205 [Lachnospiraceae bacterium]|nr:hypothetical protein [Lachnospiraceae bacterium]
MNNKLFLKFLPLMLVILAGAGITAFILTKSYFDKYTSVSYGTPKKIEVNAPGETEETTLPEAGASSPDGGEEYFIEEPPEEDMTPEEAAAYEEEKVRVEDQLSEVENLKLDTNLGYIFVGDSRFVEMNRVLKISDQENCFMVAKIGEGYKWFSTDAIKQINRIRATQLFPAWKLIICLGINDLGNLSNYLKKYGEMWGDYDITLVSVNPVRQYGSITNSQIEDFNHQLKLMGLPYIDTYQILMSTGFETTDGLHYQTDTTRKIYNGILLGIQEEDSDALVAEPAAVLSDSALGRKKSLQNEILSQNKRVMPTVPASSNTAPATADVPATAPQSPATANDKVQGSSTESSPDSGQTEAGSGEGSSEQTPAEESPHSSDTSNSSSTDTGQGGQASDGSSSGGGSPAPQQDGRTYISGQWMTDQELQDYGLTPEQIEQLKRDGHL